MRARILISVFCFLLSAFGAHANLTNLVRETFSGYGTNTSSVTGAFEIVTGTWNHRAVGPRLSTDTTAGSQGWSSRMDSTANASAIFHITNVWTAAASNGCFGMWIRPDVFAASAGGGSILILGNTAGNNVVNLQLSQSNLTFNSQVGAPFSGTIEQWQAFRWYWLAVEWHDLSPANNNYDVRIYRMALEETAPTLIQAWTNSGANGAMAQVGPFNGSSGFRFSGRIGMASLYQTANIGDGATYDTAIVRPPTNNPTWFVNTSSGNDTNSGALPAEAWLTAGKINEEAQTAGILGASNYVLGSTIVMDTSAAVLDISATNLTFATRGLNVKATNAPYWTNLLSRTLTNSLFVAHLLPNVYHQPVNNNAGFGQSNVVIWEDDKWMLHATGATFISVSASNYVATNAGSFYTDGATNYVHPFGNSNPTTDGKSYTRSVARDVTGAASAINLNGSDMNFRDCVAHKTCMVRTTDNDALGAYNVGTGGLFGGTSVVANCILNYGSKHCLGLVAGTSDSYLLVSDVTAEQDSPYGSESPFVSFMSAATMTNNVHYYLRCISRQNIGLIGSTAGANGNNSVFLSHNSSSGIQFRSLTLDSCTFGGYAAMAVCSNAIVINCTLGGVQPNAVQSNIVLSTRFTGIGLDLSLSGASNSLARNCIAYHTNVLGGGGWNGWLLKGPATVIENCTLDFSGVTSSAPGSDTGVIVRKGWQDLTFRDNVINMGTNQYAVFHGFTTNDTYSGISNNLYHVGSKLAALYTNGAAGADRTFAQWQALGFDANSLSVPDVRFDSQFRLLGDSPARDFGVSQGVASDFSGALWPNRNDAGAIEYRRPIGFGLR